MLLIVKLRLPNYILFAVALIISCFEIGITQNPLKEKSSGKEFPLSWYRPVDQPVFTNQYGNNHDAIIFREEGGEYPYYLIISHEKSAAHLWRAKEFTWSSEDWELVSDQYIIDNYYEFDDGVKVGDRYFIYEGGNVYTFSGNLEDGNNRWEKSGSFPVEKCDDVGVYYEDGWFHIFGEYGEFPHGPDGTSLSHYRSRTGLGEWELIDEKAVDPNPDGGHKYGVGDATIEKIGDRYYLFCDRETMNSPYRIIAWTSKDINTPFQFLDVVIEPRSDQTKDWDNHRIQDGDIVFVPEKSLYAMFCNMKDVDGTPGPSAGNNFESSHLGKGETRVVGTFFLDSFQEDKRDSWPMHVLDKDPPSGSDGVKVADVNNDGFKDLVSGFEEGGTSRIYIHPGNDKVKGGWEYVELPSPDVEDAVLVDLDKDGQLDLVTASEGKTNEIRIHWAPDDKDQYLSSIKWKTMSIPVVKDLSSWMYIVPADLDGDDNLDLIIGSKRKRGLKGNDRGFIGWLQSPDNPREMGHWKFHSLSTAGWIMSIERTDMDHDGDLDILLSDRKNSSKSGVRWLENPGVEEDLMDEWESHTIGVGDGEPMFLTQYDLDSDGQNEILVPDLYKGLTILKCGNDPKQKWEKQIIQYPEWSGTRGKAVAVGNIIDNENAHIVLSFEEEGKVESLPFEEYVSIGKYSVIGAYTQGNPISGNWNFYKISGLKGRKFDLVNLIDMDGDGDIDVLTNDENEEGNGLGVVWYENPSQ